MNRPLKILHTFNTKQEFINYIIKEASQDGFFHTNVLSLKNISFQFEDTVFLPIYINTSRDYPNLQDYLNKCQYEFVDCEFNQLVQVKNVPGQVTFDNCDFNKALRLTSTDKNLTFRVCNVLDLDCRDSVFGSGEVKQDNSGKLRFHKCHLYDTNFTNTTFHGLADFWGSVFYKPVVFYKTDFMDVTVFSNTTFKENVLFTYALINKLIILRGTKPEKGFDLSLAILSGNLSVFNFKLRDFEAHDTVKISKEKFRKQSDRTFDDIYEEIYENVVSEKAKIPIKNQRETYRILKAEFESKKSIAQSLQYKYLEKETFRKELKRKYSELKKEDSFKNLFIKFKYNASNFLDRINLKLNKLSNNYGLSYGKAFVFIIGVGWLFFYLSLIATNSFEFSRHPKEWEFEKGLGYFVQYLIPTHKFNYMGEEIQLTSLFYVFDFIGRTLVGYGIYQFIQAFRKYR